MKRTSSRPLKANASGFILIALTLTACANLERSTQSGYAHTNHGNQQAFGRDRRAVERGSVRKELVRSRDESLYDNEEEAISARMALRKAEQALEGRQEREQYFSNKPYMRSDRERLRFLRLSSYEERERWLNANGIGVGSGRHPASIQPLVDVNDIAVGFTKQAVRDSWGEPELIEVAGNPIYGHERWHYSEQTSSTEGYRSQRRVIYFESGRVIGWESN